MLKKFKGKYFNGISSASLEASVKFINSNNEICFQTENGDLFFWDISDIQFDSYHNLIEIRNKKNLDAILKIEDENFIRKFYQVLKRNKALNLHTRLTNLSFTKISIISICILSLISLLYFYALPRISDQLVSLLPESFDNQLGEIVMDTYIYESSIDTEKTKYLQEFASELNLENTKPLKFSVVKSDEINAFALPNGQIVIYTGILKGMKSYDALVALIGHEVAHVNKRHSIKGLCRDISGYMIISLIFSDINGIMSILIENAHHLKSLSYSREFEDEADKYGLKILIKNNVNPNGIIELFEQLEKVDNSNNMEFIQTHPLTENRKKNIKKIISESVYEIKTNNNLASIFKKLKN